MTRSELLAVGRPSTTCRARRLQVDAQRALSRNEHIAAACMLRESARQAAFAMASYYGAWSRKMIKSQSTTHVVRGLVSQQRLSAVDTRTLYECLVLGNRLAHCVRPFEAHRRLHTAVGDLCLFLERVAFIVGDAGMDETRGQYVDTDIESCTPENFSNGDYEAT